MKGHSRKPSIIDSIVMINTVDSAMKVAHDILSTLEAASSDLAANEQYIKKYLISKAEQLVRIANGIVMQNDESEQNEVECSEEREPKKKTAVSKFLRYSGRVDQRAQKEKRRNVERGMLQPVLPPLFLKAMPRFMEKPFPRPPPCLYTPPHVIKRMPLSTVSGLFSTNTKKRTRESDNDGPPLKKSRNLSENVPATSLHSKKRAREPKDEEDVSSRPRKEPRLSNTCREVVLYTAPPSPPPSPPRRRPLPLPRVHHNHHLFVHPPSTSAPITPSQARIEERRKYLKLRALGMLTLNPIPELRIGSRSAKRPSHASLECLLVREHLCNRRNLPGNLTIRSAPISPLVRSSFTRDEVHVLSEPKGGYRTKPDPFSIATRLKWRSPLSSGEEEDDW